jgi:hypothetical protein
VGATSPEACRCDERTLTNVRGSCVPKVTGCTKPTAKNFNQLANIDDGSCIFSNLPVSSTERTIISTSDNTLQAVFEPGSVDEDTVVIISDASVEGGACVIPESSVVRSDLRSITLSNGQTQLGGDGVTLSLPFDCDADLSKLALMISSDCLDWEETLNQRIDIDTCTITGDVLHFSTVSVFETSKSSDSSSSNNVGVIAGIVVGAAVALGVLGLVVRHRQNNRNSNNNKMEML